MVCKGEGGGMVGLRDVCNEMDLKGERAKIWSATGREGLRWD